MSTSQRFENPRPIGGATQRADGDRARAQGREGSRWWVRVTANAGSSRWPLTIREAIRELPCCARNRQGTRLRDPATRLDAIKLHLRAAQGTVNPAKVRDMAAIAEAAALELEAEKTRGLPCPFPVGIRPRARSCRAIWSWWQPALASAKHPWLCNMSGHASVQGNHARSFPSK